MAAVNEGPLCACGSGHHVTRRKADGTWRKYANRTCSGKAVGRDYQGVTAATLAGHDSWRTDRWRINHEGIVKALQKFKRGEVDLATMTKSIVLVEQRAEQRGYAKGRRA